MLLVGTGFPILIIKMLCHNLLTLVLLGTAFPILILLSLQPVCKLQFPGVCIVSLVYMAVAINLVLLDKSYDETKTAVCLARP